MNVAISFINIVLNWDAKLKLVLICEEKIRSQKNGGQFEKSGGRRGARRGSSEEDGD